MRTPAKAVLIVGALGLALTAQRTDAQDNRANATPGPAASDQENVVVGPPDNTFIVSPPLGRSWIGAPIVDVSISRTIRMDDLDLRTDDGVRQLRGRVFAAAGALCRWMNAMYPIDHDRNSGPWLQASPCYRNAVRNAMRQANAAIRAARGGTYAGYDDDDDSR
jgi:UrcA family protein